MTPADMDAFVGRVIEREGRKFTNDPDDAGGPTKFGITIPVLAEFRGCPVSELTAADIEALTEHDARDIYFRIIETEALLWKAKSVDLAELVFDIIVNSGREKAIVLLQRALDVDDDGQLGPGTQKAMDAMDARALFIRLIRARVLFRATHVQAVTKDLKYLDGWQKRDLSFLDRVVTP